MRMIVKMVLAVIGVTALGLILEPGHLIAPEAQAWRLIPEPSTISLLAAGLGLTAFYRKSR
jgi:ABC-type Mn2+/Zn2+ transport system permease subunit